MPVIRRMAATGNARSKVAKKAHRKHEAAARHITKAGDFRSQGASRAKKKQEAAARRMAAAGDARSPIWDRGAQEASGCCKAHGGGR